jgi:hypothetical protein
MESIISHLEGSSSQQKILVKGNAGTGKTYLMVNLYVELLKKKYLPVILTPTNKISMNAFSAIRKLGITRNIKIKTLHKYFKCYFDVLSDSQDKLLCNQFCCVDHVNTKVTFKEFIRCSSLTGQKIQSGENVILVDEASMLTHEFMYMLSLVSSHLILIGDSNQLSPINDNCSVCSREACNFSAFTQPYDFTVEVTQQMRNTSNLYPKIESFLKLTNKKYSNAKLESILISLFPVKKLEKLLPLKSPIICYHNERVDHINLMLKYGEKQVITNDYAVLESGGSSDLPVSKIFRVIDVESAERYIPAVDLKCNVRCYTRNDKASIWCDDEDSEREDDNSDETFIVESEHREEFKMKARFFKDNYEAEMKFGKLKKLNNVIREYLSVIKPAYAITTHKSQGQTFEESYLDYKDILSCASYDLKIKMLYTAMTRSSGNVYLVKIDESMKKMHQLACDTIMN